MFKAIHGIVPTCLSDRIFMNFDVIGYDTRWSDKDLYRPSLRKEVHGNSFIFMGDKLWNELPDLYKTLQILNHLNVITKCTNLA